MKFVIGEKTNKDSDPSCQ